MNYERIISDRRTDSHQRKVHIAPQNRNSTLCGRVMNRRFWRVATPDDSMACDLCASFLQRITGGSLSAPPKIVKLEMSPSQYNVARLLQTGLTLAEIDRQLGWKRTASVHLRNLCDRNEITVPELRAMLAYIHLIDPASKRRKPTVYQVGNRWVAGFNHQGKKEYLGSWSTKEDAVKAWQARYHGKPLEREPSRFGIKPLVYLKRGKWRAVLWDGPNRKNILIGTYAAKDEAIAAWQHAKQNGVYIPGRGIVKL